MRVRPGPGAFPDTIEAFVIFKIGQPVNYWFSKETKGLPGTVIDFTQAGNLVVLSDETAHRWAVSPTTLLVVM